MGVLTITCIHCGYARQVADEKVPAGQISVTCPNCKKVFIFDKSAVQKMIRTRPVPPAAPPAPPSPEPGERKKSVKTEARQTRKRIVYAVLSIILAVVVAVSLYAHLFRLYPVIAEKALITGLFSNMERVQRFSITRLRAYPTRNAALSLVIFINLKNMRQAPDPKKPDTPAESRRRELKHTSDLALAEQATETLCILSGHSFNTYYKKESYIGHSWSRIEEQRWPSVLSAINSWALEVFGPDGLSGISGSPALLSPPLSGMEQK